MKTTIDIPDGLLRQARRLARERGTTLKAVIETALRDALAAGKKPPGKFSLETHTFRGRGLQPGLSWDDWSAIRSMSYEGRGG
jgi:hypothetical protein